MPPYAGTLSRPRRKHDRSKYPWRAQRLRRKVIQTTLVSSLALLFLCGALYLMLTARPPADAGSRGGSTNINHGVVVVTTSTSVA
jgi:hypothetical protein